MLFFNCSSGLQTLPLRADVPAHNPHRQRKWSLATVCLLALLAASAAKARVLRLVVEQREPAGRSGEYQRLTGHFYGELDPRSPLNGVINDILLAPRN